MRIAYDDACSLGTFTLSHTPFPGGSSAMVTPYLPISNLGTAALRHYTMMTTTASVMDYSQGAMLLRCAFPSIPAEVSKVFALLNHNLFESDNCELQVFATSNWTGTAQIIPLQCSVDLRTSPSRSPNALRSCFVPIPAGSVASSLQLVIQRGIFRSQPFRFGRVWFSPSLQLDDAMGSDWSIDYIDNGRTELSRRGSMRFSEAQRLRRVTVSFPGMDAESAIGTNFAQDSQSLLGLLEHVGQSADVILIPREELVSGDGLMQRERSSVYGVPIGDSGLNHAGMVNPGEGRYNANLSVLERT